MGGENMPHKYSRTGKSTPVFSLQAKISEAGTGADVYLLLEPLGVLGNEVSHLPESPESNSCDGEMLTRVADETNCDKKEVAHNFLLYFRTGREKRSSSWMESY